MPTLLRGDIEPIRPGDEPPKLEEMPVPEAPSMPEPPKFEIPTMPEAPIPEMREMPEPPRFEIPEMPGAPTIPEDHLLPAPSGEKEVQVFDKTIPTMKEEPEVEVIRHMPSRPAFVAVDDYKRIINDTNIIRSKLMDAENFVRRLGDLKNEEERTFEKWRSQLESVEKKLSYVDKIIAKAR